MTNIPIIIPRMDICSFPIDLEAGNNSSNEMYIITPPTIASIVLNKNGVIKGVKIIQVTTAPNGSLIPERNDHLNAFFLFPVHTYIGTATAIPSGML